MKKRFYVVLTGALVCSWLSLSAQTKTGAKLNPKAYAPFELGELKPEGWLKDWAQRAAKGMTKTMGEDYTEFVKGWGDANCGGSGGWWHYEQTGYYTDGFTRLAYLLDDSCLMKRSQDVMAAVVARQKPNGYIFSNSKDFIAKWGTKDIDWGVYWSEGVFCRAALAYYSATRDQRVLEMLKKVYSNFPVFSYAEDSKGPFHGAELDYMRKLCGLENMFELSRITGDMSFANRALEVLKGYEPAFIDSWVHKKEFLRTAIAHGVSWNEFSKLPAIGYIYNNDSEYLAATINNYEFLQENSMLPTGVNSSNEYLHGVGAFEAAESCDVTDFMWSNIWMARATGDARYGDRIEQDAFNALPGSVSASFTSCVYTQAPNRIPGFHLRIRDDGAYYKEMHWPTCCPANINRALPNYIMNMAMINGEGDLMWLTYGPVHLQTRKGIYDIVCETEYPFRDELTFKLNAIPQKQVLRFRVPSWCKNPSLTINGKTVKFKIEDNFIVLNNKWKEGDQIKLKFPMTPVFVEGCEKFPYFEGKKAPSWGIMVPLEANMKLDGFVDQGRCAWVTYGPLLMAMSMQQNDRDGFNANEELWTEYRYALSPDALNGCKVELTDMPKKFGWNYTDAPLSVSAKAQLVDWNPDKGDPVMPLTAPAILQKDVNVKLVPYGFLACRMSMFPLVGK